MKILTTGIVKLEKDKFKNITNDKECILNKPLSGGFWGSTYLENYLKDKSFPSSWYKFAIHSGLGKNIKDAVIYSLTKSAKIYELDSVEKYDYLKENYSTTNTRYKEFISVDWEKLSKDYDAFHLSLDMFYELRKFKYYRNMDFYSWDCESYLIFNFDCIDQESIQYIQIDNICIDEEDWDDD